MSARTPTSPARLLPPKGISIPRERLDQIETHVATLAKSARAVALELPISADISDFLRVLDEAGRG